jgi:hypothetical protein
MLRKSSADAPNRKSMIRPATPPGLMLSEVISCAVVAEGSRAARVDINVDINMDMTLVPPGLGVTGGPGPVEPHGGSGRHSP